MNVQLRPATAADFEHFLRLFPHLGTDDPAPDPARFDRELRPGMWFLEEDGEVAGVVRYEKLDREGFVRCLIVDPARRRRGHGRRLMQVAAAELRAGGCTRWRLNHLAGNLPAETLYHSLGFTTAHATVIVRLPWDAVARLPASAGAVVGTVEPERDRAIEAAFALPAGQVAHYRDLGPSLLGARAGDDLGLARFDPRFPGAYPFRATTPALFRPLLEAMRPHARPGDPWVQLVIEDGPAAAAVLEAAGALRFRELLQLAGEIPTA